MDERVREIKRQYGLDQKRYPTNNFRRQEEQKTGKEFLLFQIYVSGFFIITVFALSMIHTEQTNQLTSHLKNALYYQMTADDLMEIKEQAVSVMKNGTDFFSDLKEQAQETEQSQKTNTNTIDTTVPFEAPKETTQQKQKNQTDKTNETKQFQTEEQSKNVLSPPIN